MFPPDRGSVLLDAFIEAAQLMHFLIRFRIGVEIDIGKIPLQPPKLSGLAFTLGLTRNNVDQLDVEDVLQLYAVAVIDSAIIHSSVEQHLANIG